MSSDLADLVDFMSRQAYNVNNPEFADDSMDTAAVQSNLTQNKGGPARKPQNAGLKHLPSGGLAQQARLAGSTESSNLYGAFFTGPYSIGLAFRQNQIGSLSMETWLGAAANIVTTGWIINSVTNRESRLDSFGLIVSALAQVGYGALLSAAPTVRRQVGQTQ